MSAFPQKLNGAGGASNEPIPGAVLLGNKPYLEAEDVRGYLRAEVARLGGQRAFAKARAVNQAQVSLCLAGGEVTEAIGNSLGLGARRVFIPLRRR